VKLLTARFRRSHLGTASTATDLVRALGSTGGAAHGAGGRLQEPEHPRLLRVAASCGKPTKVALVACIRKLQVVCNSAQSRRRETLNFDFSR
jgi:hypothetical protein